MGAAIRLKGVVMSRTRMSSALHSITMNCLLFTDAPRATGVHLLTSLWTQRASFITEATKLSKQLSVAWLIRDSCNCWFSPPQTHTRGATSYGRFSEGPGSHSETVDRLWCAEYIPFNHEILPDPLTSPRDVDGIRIRGNAYASITWRLPPAFFGVVPAS